MKNLSVIILCVVSFSFALAQGTHKTQIPAKAEDSFKKAYPEAANVKWEKEKDKFEVNFKNKGVLTSIEINNDGKILETEVSIEKSSLPKGIEEQVLKNYNGYKITETAKITDEKGTIKYEVQISKGKKHKDIYFDEKGNELKK